MKLKEYPLILEGGMPFSDFRLDALKHKLAESCTELQIRDINVRAVFILKVACELPPVEMDRICGLLAAKGDFHSSEGFFVTPRKGTISPWSSKATDIFHNCSIHQVARVEKGLHYRLVSEAGKTLTLADAGSCLDLLRDRMTEGAYESIDDIFEQMQPTPCKLVDILSGGKEALIKANAQWGLALSEDEISYLYGSYRRIQRNPSDVELVMFGQVNSEHCRHKIFNADWIIDGKPMPCSLFEMISNTHRSHPEGTLVAYNDNAAVIEGSTSEFFEASCNGRRAYDFVDSKIDMVIKVETHNHPTAISPYPGAATGVGGEIRDESATGRAGRSKAGLSAFMVSNLRVPDFVMPWEKDFAEFPARFASPLQIMLEGPIGGARFGNEFGRPQLCGIFKTYEQKFQNGYYGYHKPIMVAGGMGNIKREHALKKNLSVGSLIIQIGGPALRIGLGGGAASSMTAGSNVEDLDYDSVQRDNAEMERRCQCVIDSCMAAEDKNPIISIHDLGAGGLSNGCPELVEETGGEFYLRQVNNEDMSMSPMEIWCCEAQERYVLAIEPGSVDEFMAVCRRERCPAAVIGRATGDNRLVLDDTHFKNKPIDIDIDVILGKPPKTSRDVKRKKEARQPMELDSIKMEEAFKRVLQLPAVANKNFLITIADRSVTGMVARDQMCGPYQTPVADAAVVMNSYRSYEGQAMAMGERTVLSLVSGPVSGRMAVGEALTNIVCCAVGRLGNVKLSANWMCACGEEGEDAGLYDTVKAVGMELCPELGISIPVGKDSLSMRTVWQDGKGVSEKMTAPLSLVVSAFAPVSDVRLSVTPELKPVDSELFLLDLGAGKNRIACSSLAQVYNQAGDTVPDLDNPELFARFFDAMQELLNKGLLLACHDRSDGGLAATLAEMAISARRGLSIELGETGADPLSALFAEELGMVVQVNKNDLPRFSSILESHSLSGICHQIGVPSHNGYFSVSFKGKPVIREKVSTINAWWSELTYKMQSLRDNPECAIEEYESLSAETDSGMNFHLTFDENKKPSVINRKNRPRVVILREQGVNGHIEMAMAFHAAGFECLDVHMTDLFDEKVNFDECAGLVACGGFSYGDVLGAGSGWAKSILYNEKLKELFTRFFARPDTFSLGVCNGCQMMSQLKDLIPGAENWPDFVINRSGQFEARYCTVEIMESSSVFLKEMAGSRLGIPVAHGEGRARFGDNTGEVAISDKLVTMRYVDNSGQPAVKYPFNPNGSPHGITGLTTTDGRVTIMMPHPERGFRSAQMSYRPLGMFEDEAGPWLKMFYNAREFAG